MKAAAFHCIPPHLPLGFIWNTYGADARLSSSCSYRYFYSQPKTLHYTNKVLGTR